MKLSEISTGLKLNPFLENVSDGDLSSLVKQYPFSSTLRMLLARRQLESMAVDVMSDLPLAVISSNSTIVLDSFFSFPDKVEEGQITNQNIQDESEIETGALIGVTKETLPITDELKLQTEAIEKSTTRIERNVENPTPRSKVISELDHLSDYSAWLLQLKQIDKPAEVKATDVSAMAKNERSILDRKKKAESDKSSELNKEIASESLAKLLSEQGHYNKAREMYSKLSLIIPEKSAYFAVQIEKIKGK